MVPHYLHQATLTSMRVPCQTADIWEAHIFDVGKSRQSIVETFLSVPEATHLLFVDDDIIIPNRDSLVGMFQFLEKNHEFIVSGLYYARPTPHYPLILILEERKGKFAFGFPFAENPVPKNSLVKVGALPAGFLLIKREVFEKIESPWFVYHDAELAKKSDSITPVGEDVYFSWKARKAGFKLWVDTRADLLHYVPSFVGSKEALAYVDMKLINPLREAEVMRKEYLEELEKPKR
jgi:GT2 family glycosyltransferase